MMNTSKASRTITTRSGTLTLRLEVDRNAAIVLAESLGALMADMVADGTFKLPDTARTSPPARPSEYLTVMQLAERLGMSRQTIDAWRYKGTGPRWRKLGRAIRYAMADVDAWLARQGG